MLGAIAPDQVPAQLTSAHIGLAPYTRTGPRYFSPLKLFEYLAAGLAVVAGDLPGVVDVTADDHRVVIPAGDAGRLADAVAGLVGDPAQRAALGRAGRAHVARRHTWAHRAARVTALVREIRAV